MEERMGERKKEELKEDKGRYKVQNNPKKENEKDYFGLKGENYQDLSMIIIRYNAYNDINVMFQDGTIVEHQTVEDFLKGMIKNPKITTLRNLNVSIDRHLGDRLEKFAKEHKLDIRTIIETAIKSIVKGDK